MTDPNQNAPDSVHYTPSCDRVTDENPRNASIAAGSTPSSSNSPGFPSSSAPFCRVFSRFQSRALGTICKFRFHQTLASSGHLHARLLTGGCVFRSKPQLIFENHLCCLTSLAPDRLPSRRVSSLMSSCVITSLHLLRQHQRTCSPGTRSSNSRRNPRVVRVLHREVHDVVERLLAILALERRRCELEQALADQPRVAHSNRVRDALPQHSRSSRTEGYRASTSRRQRCGHLGP